MPDSYLALLERVIDDGIEAARQDYARPDEKAKLDGSVAGFEDCRGKSPEELSSLLTEARQATHKARLEQFSRSEHEAENYWYVRCREAEIEWVCNCVSAALMNSGLPVIVPPTARGVFKAAEILGVRDREAS